MKLCKIAALALGTVAIVGSSQIAMGQPTAAVVVTRGTSHQGITYKDHGNVFCSGHNCEANPSHYHFQNRPHFQDTQDTIWSSLKNCPAGSTC
jgi:hypothetical protein